MILNVSTSDITYRVKDIYKEREREREREISYYIYYVYYIKYICCVEEHVWSIVQSQFVQCVRCLLYSLSEV